MKQSLYLTTQHKKEIILTGMILGILMFDMDKKDLEATGLTFLFLFRVYHASLSKLLVI